MNGMRPVGPSAAVATDGVLGLFDDAVARYPHETAIRLGDRRIGYRELADRVERLSARLARGARPGTVVANGATSPYADALIFLAARRAGLTVLPVDLSWPEARLEHLYQEASVALLALDGAGGDIGLSVLRGEHARPCEFADTAYVIYTSGSTGRPKGVAVSTTALARRMSALGRVPGVAAGQSVLAMTSHTFDISLAEYLLPLLHGAEVICAPPQARIDPAEFALLTDRERPDIVQATPSFWRLADRSGAWPRLDGTTVWCGGEPMTERLAAQLRERAGAVWNLYGPTEATIWATAWPVAADTPVSLGSALPGVKLFVRPVEHEGEYAAGAGELVLSGEGLASGYLGRGELTADRFTTEWGDGGQLGYRTGDVVEFSPDGTLRFLGRVDDQVKVRGHRIELGELEAVVETCPGVVDCAVTTVLPPGESDPVLYAFVIAADGARLTTRRLRTELMAQLPTYLLPRKIVLISEFPRNAAGKVDRRALGRRVTGALPAD